VPTRSFRSLLALATGAALAVAVVTAGALPATADTAPKPGVPATVSSDALPTVQINGVVWTQVVIGDTVYVGGRFSQARPAGVPKGATGTAGRVARSNFLAYDITTGALLPDIAPRFNSEVRALAASADGSTVYAVGNFTAVDGKKRTRVAALDARTGASRYMGSLNSMAYAVATKGGTVYVGGQFTSANGKKRSRLAAFNKADGSLRGWSPSANRAVQAVAVAPDGNSVVVAGHFDHINSKAAYGSARVNVGSGRSNLSWAVNKLIGNSGPNAAIYSLSGDGSYAYLTGYSYHPKGLGGRKRLEGTIAVSWNSGKTHWIEDCHGDTYDSASVGGVLYTASHAHDCYTVGSFSKSKPLRYNHAMAFTVAATGKLKTNHAGGYSNYAGSPAPTVLNWWPAFVNGSYTGLNQAAWSVTGDSRYVVYGGEFPSVNGVAQQGLVRFAVSSLAPNTDGPRVSGNDLKPTLKALGGGAVSVTFTSDFDRDNEYLTYAITRTSTGDPVVQTFTSGSRYYFSRPVKTITQSGLVAGTLYAYRITATDPFGNTAVGTTATITAS
jgi:hypothetical protein